MTARNVTMTEFAYQLSRHINAIVQDNTGLKGNFDLTLDAAPDDRVNSDGSMTPSVFTAIQQQLGLKLEATKGPVEVLVVDHVEKMPVPN